MKVRVQLVVCAEDGREERVQEVAILEKKHQRIEHLGFTLAEAKHILKMLQQYLLEQRAAAWASWARPVRRAWLPWRVFPERLVVYL